MKLALSASLTAALLAGCATAPKDIQPFYSSPLGWDKFDCTQLAEESHRIADRAAKLSGIQQAKANNDAIAVGAAIVIFAPALWFIGGQDNAPQLGYLKGQNEAVTEAAKAKGCAVKVAA